jgi:PAS domain S-box-containing protein
MSQIGTPLPGSYDYHLVALSIFVAISASYAALDLGGRVTAARGWVRSVWLAAGASAMGLGIWSMHFTGMLAFKLPVPVTYHWPTVLLSLLAAMIASAVALYVASRETMGRMQEITGGILMGLAIVGMHYIGMAAMRLSATCQYRPLLVAVSIFVAIAASLAALMFTFDYREDFRGTTLAKFASATVMGVGISVMHYVGMTSAKFVSSTVIPETSHVVSISALGLGGIALGTLVVQIVAVLTSSMDRRIAAQAQELQTSQRFRQIAGILKDVLVLSKPDLSEVLFVNRAYETIWGRTLESLYDDPDSWLEGVHPEDRRRVEEHVHLLIGGKSVENLEYRVIRPDGAMSWVRLRAYPILDEQGRCYRVVAIVHEFTMRKMAEDARQEIEEQYRTVVDTAIDAVVSIDENSQIIFVNPATTKLFGYESAELVGQPLTTLMPESLRDSHKLGLQNYLTTGERRLNWQGVELTGLRKNGVEFPVEVSFAEIARQGRRVFTGFIRDITERKRAEERLRLVIDTIPTMAWTVRPDGSVDFLNQRWLEYTGLSLKEEIEDPMRAIHPEDLPAIRERWRANMAAGKPFEDEMRLRGADGEYRWFMVRTAPLRDEHGGIVKWYGTTVDIEDRKRAELEARTLIEAIPQQIWSGPPDGTLDYCNERWRSYAGLGLEESRRGGWQAMLHPDDRERVLKAWRESVANGTPYEQEERHRGTDGEYRWFLARGVPLRDTEGRIIRWYGTNTDIEERKRAEETLRSSEREQRHVAAQLERERARLVEAQTVAKMGSWEVELQSLDVIWSEQTHRIFETDPSHFHPTRPRFLEFIHPEDSAKVDAAMVTSLDRRSPGTVEYRIVLPDGRVKILEERWQVFLDDEGTPVRLAGTCRDITERVQAEEDLQRLSGRLLQSHDEERRRIARELHDSMGQNLVALATDLSQLRTSVPSSARKLRESASRCEELANECVREIRTLSYLMYPPLLDESGLADAIRHFVDGFTARTGIKAELNVNPKFGRMRKDVEVALFRVVQESLANIHRHSGSKRAKILLDRRSDDVAVEVSDSGRGASGQKGGTKRGIPFQPGIGISSMIERVKLIGGRLEIVSGASGTTVRVTIPEVAERDEKASHADV